MTWATGKAALVTKLKTIAITSPVSLTTSTVYETPPASLTGSTVAWVLFPPRIRPERLPGGWRENVYRYRARLFVLDADHGYAALLVENIVEATIAVFDNQSSLRTGGIQHINGPDVDEPGILKEGAATWHIADCFFDIKYGEAVTFG
jgi:hypothetical protein